MTPARSSDGLTENQKGLLYALCCYLLWGLFPLYWYPLTHSGIDAGQLLAQRIVWSALFSVVLVAVFKQTHVLLDARCAAPKPCWCSLAPPLPSA